MGTYLNPGAASFVEAVESEIYVDKTAMVSYLNSVVRTKRKYVAVSRPRRFGKTMAADMACAYYGRGAGSRHVFESLSLAGTAPALVGGRELPWDAWLGAFDVVRVTMTEFMGGCADVRQMLDLLTWEVVAELADEYPDVGLGGRRTLPAVMAKVYAKTRRQFVVVIDEWDAPMRERRGDAAGQRLYLDFLREWLKDREWVALAYMTGILPIKKYGAHSALNMFGEYSMARPQQLAQYTGFTESEVRGLCDHWHVDFGQVRDWYDGYRVVGVIPREERTDAGEPPQWSLYSPLSVVYAMSTGQVASYWSRTETYRALAEYIRMDFDGLKEAVALMMDGGRVRVSLDTYQNDMETFACRDDVLALLVHLGYLGYDSRTCEAFVPNKEVMEEFRVSTREPAWDLALREYEASKELVRATLEGDAESVARALDSAHDRASNLGYNSEAALSYAVRLAYYAALRLYTELVELDSGRGFVDLCYLPAPSRPDLPALVVELKWEQAGGEGALAQVRDRRYPDRLSQYEGNVLLVGISYDRDARPGTEGHKRHRCAIERA